MTKKLYKSKKDRMVCGVCGGIAEYFAVDPVLVRVIFVILFFAGGSALIAYIIGCIIIPSSPREELPANQAPAPSSSSISDNQASSRSDMAHTGALFIGIILIVLGAILLMRNIPIFNDYYWWFRHYAWRFFWPGVLVVIGLVLILRGARK